ncbi:crystallin beta/gamma motif-containing protein [Caudoviricetes sp.]|nr:crystallin beta/gamma motif-containing protein [Caudoviricetes sp.]
MAYPFDEEEKQNVFGGNTNVFDAPQDYTGVFDKAVAEYTAERQAIADHPAVASLYMAQDAKPDHYARAKTVASEVGMPTFVVSDNLPEYEKQLEQSKNIDFLQKNPNVASFITPQNAPVIKDDLDNLAWYEKAMNGIANTYTDLVSGGGAGIDEAEQARQQAFKDASDWMAGNDPETLDRKQDPNEPDSWAYQGSKFVTSLTKQQLDSAGNGGLLGAGAGAVVGGTRGFVTGGPTGAAVGAVGGAAIGFRGGNSIDQAIQSAGQTYRTVFEKSISEGVDKVQARKLASDAAYAVAGSNAVIGYFGMRTPAGIISGGPTRSFGRAIAGSAVEEGVEEAVTEAVNIGIEENAYRRAGIDNLYSNPTGEKFYDIASRLSQAALGGAVGGGILGGAFEGSARLLSALKKNTPNPLEMERGLLDAIEAVKNSKTFQRDPDTFREFAKHIDALHGGGNVYVSPEVFQNLIAGTQARTGMNEKQLYEGVKEVIPNFDSQIEEANKTGADISIPASSFTIFFQEEAPIILPDAKASPEGMTPNQTRQAMADLPDTFQKDMEDYLNKLNDPSDPKNQFQAQVYNDVLTNLNNENWGTEQERQAIALLTTQRYVARAYQNNGDYGTAWDEYQRNPMTIQSVVDVSQADVMANQAYDNFDIGKQGNIDFVNGVPNFGEPSPQLPRVEQTQEPQKGKAKKIPTPPQQASSPVTNVPQENINVPVGPEANPTVGGLEIGEGQIKVGSQYVPTRVMIVEADSLNPSMVKGEAQPRDRTRAASEAQIEKYANKLDPNYLTANFPDQVNGSPTLTFDGKITGGNARTEAIKRAYNRSKADSYRQMVEQEAIKAGVDISGMKKPVLIRVFKNQIDTQSTAILSNEGGTASQSALEQANVDATRLGNIEAFTFNDNGVLLKTENEIAVNQFLSQFPTEEQGRFIDKNGELSSEGVRRIQSAILYKAYGDTPVLSRMLETTDTEAKNVVNALTKLAPHIAKVQEGIDRGVLYNIPVKQDLLDAVDKFLFLKKTNVKIDDFLNQGTLFNIGLSPDGLRFLKMFDENVRSYKAIAEKIDDVFNKIESYGNPNQAELFGERIVPTKADVLSGLPLVDESPFQVFNQSARARIAMFDTLNVIQLFKNSDASSIIHELGHKWLDELFLDARNAIGDMNKISLQNDIALTRKWMKESVSDILKYQKKLNKKRKNPDAKSKEAELIKEIEAKGADYINSIIDNDLQANDDASRYVRTMMHEAWARGFERYAMEGKAPNKGLKSVFRLFAKTLMNLYETVLRLNVPINDDIRSVFDRMLMADKTAKKIVDDYGVHPMFKENTQGMTPEQHQGYIQRLKNHLEIMKERLTAKRLKPIKSQHTEDAKQKMASLEEKNAKKIEESRAYTVFSNITAKKSGLLLNRKSFEENNGQGLTALMPPEIFSESSDALGLNELSGLLGYNNPTEFINEMTSLEGMRKSVETKTKLSMNSARKVFAKRQALEQFMAEYDRENATEQAENLLVSEATARIFVEELNALAKMTGNDLGYPRIDFSAFQVEAMKQLKSMTVNQAVKESKKFLASAKEKGRLAQDLLDAGDIAGSHSAKTQQIGSYLMYAYAKDFAENYANGMRLVKRIARQPIPDGMSSGHAHLLHAILNNMGLITSRSVKKSREGKDENPFKSTAYEINNFLNADKTGMREAAYVSELLKFGTEDGGQLSLKEVEDMKVEHFMDISESLKSIWKNGLEEGFVTIEGKRVQTDETVSEMARLVYALNEKKANKNQEERLKHLSDESWKKWEALGKNSGGFIDLIGASSRRMISLAVELDGNNKGVWNTMLDQGFEGVDGHYKFIRDLSEIRHKNQKSLNDVIPNHGLKNYELTTDTKTTKKIPNSATPMVLNRLQLIGIALNMGCPENLEKLVEGREFTEQDDDGQTYPTGWTKENLERLVREHLTKEDWDFISALGKQVESLWPKTQETLIHVKGITPPKVITAPVQTPFGEIEGWYWPILYEEKLPLKREEKMIGGVFEAQINASGIHGRVSGVKKPMMIDLGRILDEVERNSYYAHMATFIFDASKIIGDRKIENAVSDTKSQNHYLAMVDWLKDMANRNRRTVGMNDWLVPIGNLHQQGAANNFFAFASKTFLDSSAEYVVKNIKLGAKWSAKGHWWFVKNLFGNTAEITRFMSQFSAHDMRRGGTDKRVSEFKRHITNKWGLAQDLFDKTIELGYYMVGLVDTIGNIVLARGMYEKMVTENPNVSDYEVRSTINRLIRETSPSRDIFDQTLSQRDRQNKHLKIYTSFASALLNRVADDYNMAKATLRNEKATMTEKGKSLAEMGVRLGFKGLGHALQISFVLSLASLSYQYLSGQLSDDDEEDDTVLGTTSEILARGIIGGGASLFPIASQLYDVATSDMPYAGGSLDVRYSALRDATKSTRKLVTGKNFNEDDFVNYIEALGFGTGVPVKRPVAGVRYLYGLSSGDIQYGDDWSIPEVLGDIQRGRQINK